MIVWRVRVGNGAAFFAEKSEAKVALRKYREGKKRSDDDWGDGPDKIDIKGRDALAEALNAASGAEVL